MSQQKSFLAIVVDRISGEKHQIGFFAENNSLAWEHAAHVTKDVLPSCSVFRVKREQVQEADMGVFRSVA